MFRDVRAPEELYDIGADPYEINNLADDPKLADTLKKMRARLDTWMEATDDKGRKPESAAMFDSDMAVYTGKFKARKQDPAYRKAIEGNIALMKKWAAEGR